MAHEVAVHSKLGFSSRARWRACPASVAMSTDVADKAGPAAEEGTIAHAVKEHYMRQAFNLPGAVAGEMPDQTPPAGLAVADMAEWNATMRKHAKAYVEFVQQTIASVGDHGAMVVEEQRVAAPSLHPALFGTADTLLWFPGVRALAVIDYKYGFRDVDVGTLEDPNPQLAAYGVAGAETLGQPVEQMLLAVVQPRVPLRESVRSLLIPNAPIWIAAERDKLAREAAATEVPSAPVAGEHCRYCKAKSKCPETQKALQAVLQTASGGRDMLSIPVDELLALFSARAAFKAFWEDVEARVAQLATVGHERITIKTTQGRQMWADPKAAALTLMALGRTDLLQPVALSDALPALPEALRTELVKRSKPSQSIQVVSAPTVKEVAKIFEKYAKKS